MVNPLEQKVLEGGLGLLCRSGDGLDYAFAQCVVKGKALTDVAILDGFKYLRYVVRCVVRRRCCCACVV